MRLPLDLQLAVLALLHPSRGQVEQTCAAQGEGFQCVDQAEAEAGKLNCTASTSLATARETSAANHCSGLLGSGQNFCCRPPHNCNDRRCSNGHKGFKCFPRAEVGSQQICLLPVSPQRCGWDGSSCRCCAPKYVECEDRGCSRRGKGYQCKNEKEAKEHPVPCHANNRLCKKNCFIPNTGSTPYSPYNAGLTPTPEACQLICQMDPDCQWFNWVPASSSPSGCWLLRYPKTGENTARSTIGWVTGPKYCSKCYCCPPEDTPDPCEPTGCDKEFEGLGKCVDVKTANWDELDANFDLSAGSRDNNTCKKKETDEKDCCRCLKKKSCLDAGCKDEFGGHGICIDESKVDVAYMKEKIDLAAGQVEGKCRNFFKEDCCSCFKKITPDCRSKECEAKKGKCVIEGDIPPPNHAKSFPCNETLKCHCWVPIRPRCHDDQCTKVMQGICALSPQEPPAGYIASNYFCEGKKSCPCYVQNGCIDAQCPGKCINTYYQDPPPGHVKNGYNCNNNDRCPCYVEKVGCPPDPGCKDKNGDPGQCGFITPGHVPNGYKCNGNDKCPCHVKDDKCEDEKCTDEKKGKCIKLPTKPPAGYVPSGYNCKGNIECPCYIEKTECDPYEKCKDDNGLMGKCGKASAGYGKSSINCHDDPNCPCFLPCRSEKCEDDGGRCVDMTRSDVVIPAGYKKSNHWCNEKIECNCFMPNCPITASCKKYKGACFSKKPPGGIYQKKGKCRKGCKCYRVPAIGISLPVAINVN